VTVKQSPGPGITAARLHTEDGDIAIDRADGRVARYSIPFQPERTVALKRRETSELLAEELRRLDPDEIYARTVEELLRTASETADQVVLSPTRGARATKPARRRTGAAKKAAEAERAATRTTTAGGKKAAKKAAAKKTATKAARKKATAKKTAAKRAAASRPVSAEGREREES
jgi:hypothetical protein